MNLHKTHPEAHDAWLYAMGIDVRWRHRSAHGEEPLMAQPSPAVGVGAEEMTLPAVLAQARCWVVGEAPLSEPERRMLAGMLWSVGWSEGDVIYLSLDASNPNSHIEPVQMNLAHFPAWPYLSEGAVSASVLQPFLRIAVSRPHPPVIWLMGAADSLSIQTNRTVSLPSLSVLMQSPQLKQSAWERIKSLRAHVSVGTSVG